MVAVAIGAAAVVGAGASLIGGSAAANAQEQSSAAAIAEQRSEYNQTRSDYAPWRAAGASALGALTSAYGLPSAAGGTGTGTGTAAPYGGFFTSPGYQFRMDQGLQAIDRGAASRGILGSGATVKAEQRYGEGLAASEYDSYTARLAQLAGLGQSATAGTAAAGSSAANNISANLIASGNARASSYTNAASSVNSGINNIMSAYLMNNMGTFGGGGQTAANNPWIAASDRRLKTNIVKVGEYPDGLGIYDWNWKSDANGEKVRGVIADEVKGLRPWAYVANFRDGYDGVDYGALGTQHG